MRLRNLYELKVQPGERKGFSLGLKKLEDIQFKVAEMQQAIANLKYTSVPDVLKKQMDQLIDSAIMEKEKLYASLTQKNKKNTTVSGIPLNILKLLKGIDKNCSIIMNAYRNDGKFLYRGIKSSDDALYGKPHEERRNMSSNKKLTDIMNKAMADAGFEARRDNTTFTSGDINQANNYGNNVYIFFPKDGFHFHYSKIERDLVLSADKIRLLIDTNIMSQVREVLDANWETAKPYFDYYNNASQVFDSYKFEDDVRKMQTAVDAGALPAELKKYNSIEAFSTPEAVIDNMGFDQQNLDAAIKSKHEVLFTGPYYALRNDKFKDYVRQYLDLTKTGTLDLTPDTESEESTLDDKINQELGQKPDGFKVGDWIVHLYDKDIMGQIINNFYTNDFLQIKNYDDKLLLIHNNNAKVIKTPEIPDYQIDDKVQINTENSNYNHYNGLRGRVTKVSDSFITVKTKSSYGDTNVFDIPKIFVKLLPKVDVDNPEVGDTVKVNKGDYADHYGVITSMGGYTSAIKVKLDDDTVINIGKYDFEVVDPATKKSSPMPTHIKEDDYVRISEMSDLYPNFVGKLTKLGPISSTVNPNNTTEQSPINIKNKYLSTISEEEFADARLIHETLVIVAAGPYKGRSGKITHFKSTGTVEIWEENPPPGKSNYIETLPKYLVKQGSEAAKNLKFDDVESSDKTFVEGDYVRIGVYSEKYATAVAVVRYDSGPEKTRVLVYGSDELSVRILNSELTKIDKSEYIRGEFKMGNDVDVIKGAYKGRSGTITDLEADGRVRIKISASDPANEFVIKAPADHFEKQDVEFELLDTEPTDQTDGSEKLKVGDTVTIKTGAHAGQFGTVTGVENTGYSIQLKNDGHIYFYASDEIKKGVDNSILDIDLDWEPLEDPLDTTRAKPAKAKPSKSNIDAKQLKFKIGDGANATNANKKVKGWTIIDYNNDGVVMKNISSGNTMTRPWNLFYKANPNYAPDEPIEAEFDDIPNAEFDDIPDNDQTTTNAKEIKVGDDVNALFAGNTKGWKITGVNTDGVQVKSIKAGLENTIPWKIFFKANPEYDQSNKFSVGDEVSIVLGPFEGFTGTVIAPATGDLKEYTVQIDIFGSKNNIPLPGQFLADIDGADNFEQLVEPSNQIDQDKIKKMSDDAKQAGYITYSTLNSIMPPEKASMDQVEELLTTFNNLGINVIDDTDGIAQVTGDTPAELKARVANPDNKKELLDILRSHSNVKLLVKNAVESKFISYSISIAISVLIGVDKYNEIIKPYLELKGVKFGK